MKIYKIRHMQTGLYSAGGSYSPRWTKRGKTWNTLGHLKSHIRGIAETRQAITIRDMCFWEVVEIEVSETSKVMCKGDDMLKEAVSKIEAKEQERQDYFDNIKILREQAIGKLTDAERKALRV
jgi:hypothetical protein